jgi:hypothetical protein
MHKSTREYRDGFKAHIAAETGLFTACALTPAHTADRPTGIGLLDGEKRGLQVLASSAYGSSEVRVELRRRHHRAGIKAMPLCRVVPGGFDCDDFNVDYRARTVTCPAGHTHTITAKSHTATFGTICAGCPLRYRCRTSTKGRRLIVSDHDEVLVDARQVWANGDLASTDAGDPWSNAPSPGWSPTVTDESAAAGSGATSSASLTASPRSTSADS